MKKILCRDCRHCDIVSTKDVPGVLAPEDVLICSALAAPEKYLIKDEPWECVRFEESEKGLEKRLGNKDW